MALAHACSMNNQILTPNCDIYQSELANTWWTASDPAAGEKERVYFNADGTLQMGEISDSVRYDIQDCNRIKIDNITKADYEEWTIVSLTDNSLSLRYNGSKTVEYKR